MSTGEGRTIRRSPPETGIGFVVTRHKRRSLYVRAHGACPWEQPNLSPPPVLRSDRKSVV